MAFRQRFPIDWYILTTVVVLLTYGVVAIYSATINYPGVEGNFVRQLVWIFVAVIVAFSFYFINLRVFQVLASVLYGITLILLILTLIMGTEVAGNKSWLFFGPVGIQPSELAKFTTLLMFAGYMSSLKIERAGLFQLLLGFGIILLPTTLILLQPDTGTALVFLGMTLPIIFWIGLDEGTTYLIISPILAAGLAFFNFYLFIAFVVLSIVFVFFVKMNLVRSILSVFLNIASGSATVFIIDNILQPHQRKRLEILLDPFIDPKGAGYNIIQSEIAIGSGGWLGKGFLEGTQTQLGFLPKQWTDFIFCVVSEEYGFVGAIVLLGCYFILLWRLLKIASQFRSRFASIFTIGVFMVILIHVLINVGMTMGLVPVIGIPLPFVSYGGSSMITFMAFIGTIFSVYAHQSSSDYL